MAEPRPPDLKAKCAGCHHTLGDHYRRYDGMTGCAYTDYGGQREPYTKPCGCTGFMVVWQDDDFRVGGPPYGA